MNLLLVAQIVIALVLIGLIMLQSQGTGLGKSFAMGAQYRSRKGLERTVFMFTIVLAVLFTAVSILNMLF